MKKLFILFAIASLFNAAYSQSVGIGTNAPNASAALEVSSASKGVLLSRLTTQQRLAIIKPAPGLLVYDLDKSAFYMNDGAAWYPLGVANESNLPALSHYPTDPTSIKNFGNSVSLSGNYALIGASYDSVNNHLKQGSAYIFAKVNGTWVQQAKLTAADGLTNDNLGSCVAIDGDYAVVSACSSFGITKGAVYVFVRNGTSWSQQAKLSPNDLVSGYQFGCSLGISGIYIIAGAYYSEVSGNQGQGAAYIFKRTLSSWALQKKLVADDGTAGDFFGQSVAISGDYAVAGAPAAKIGENSFQGAAYIFVQGGGT